MPTATCLFYYDRENRQTHTVNVIGQAADNNLAGEVSETAYNSFGQPQSVRRYAARLGRKPGRPWRREGHRNAPQKTTRDGANRSYGQSSTSRRTAKFAGIDNQ
jgi:hypothetical protein